MCARTGIFVPVRGVPVFGKNWRFPPPIADFPTIIFHAYGREIRAHGFLQREVRETKRIVEGR